MTKMSKEGIFLRLVLAVVVAPPPREWTPLGSLGEFEVVDIAIICLLLCNGMRPIHNVRQEKKTWDGT